MPRPFSPAAVILIVLSVAAAAPAQTVDEIVAKNIESKGGREAWKGKSSVKMTGRISTPGGELSLNVTAKRPNLTRQEMVIKDTRLVQAFDGTTAWMINPMMGSGAPQQLPAPVAAMMKESADFDGPLFDYKSKGNTVELVGREKLGGTEVDHLKVTSQRGQVQHYYLDATSGIELKKALEVDMGKGTQMLETEMSNYKPVDGVMVPHTIKQLMDGKPVAEMTIDKVEFNAPVDDSIFQMPKK
jgi:outer membrane lipoprotein-sorting protein